MSDQVLVTEEKTYVYVTEDQSILLVEDTAAEVIEVGIQGPAGVGRDKNFLFALNGETDVTVDHQLDKYPAVTVFDSSGSEVQGDYQHLTTNSTRLVFSAGFSGKAIFN